MNIADHKLQQACQRITENCIDCMQCVSGCEFLQGIGEDPVAIAERGPSVEEAYSCSLCGLCEAVCPVSVSMLDMFAEKRTDAVEKKQMTINDYRYLFPDRKTTPMSLYREIKGIRYDDLAPREEASVVFFPGCSMITYSPELVRASFAELLKQFKGLTILPDCCGLSLYQLGLPDRGEQFVQQIKLKFQALKVKSIIMICPNCYYTLREFLKDTDIRLLTIYEALADSEAFKDDSKKAQNSEITVTLHDACPDRYDGILAGQVREALVTKGFKLVEMEHSRNLSNCCGSGGHVSHFFRPDLSENLKRKRLEEAKNSGAQVLAGYCLACVLNFAKESGNGSMRIQHVLNLLLDLDQDFSDVKTKSNEIFEGPQGEKYWEKIMAED
ncbi:MAG: (Fe-S)-binding protein [Dehalobacter sp.]|nr:(Fe-S)-binding protein [Dehalobacter sp.]